MKHKKLYIFDLSDTLVRNITWKKIKAQKANSLSALPKVIKKLREIKKTGATLAMASNMGAASFGHVTEMEIWKFVLVLERQVFRGLFKDIRLDFYHEKGQKKRRFINKRKPSPAMLLELLEDFGVKPGSAVFIGNAVKDRAAAKRAGIDFIWAHDFFEWDRKDLKYNHQYDWWELKRS